MNKMHLIILALVMGIIGIYSYKTKINAKEKTDWSGDLGWDKMTQEVPAQTKPPEEFKFEENDKFDPVQPQQPKTQPEQSQPQQFDAQPRRGFFHRLFCPSCR